MNFTNEILQAGLSIKPDLNFLLLIILWSIGTVFSIFGLTTLFLSYSKLTKMEFYILTVYIINKLAFKICIEIMFLMIYFSLELTQTCAFMLLNSTALIFVNLIIMTIFFHSLHQISSLGRGRLFRRIYKFSHSLRSFIIFVILSFAGIITFTIGYLLWAYLELRVCPSVGYVFSKFMLNAFIVVFVFPGFLPVLMYFLATAHVFLSRFVMKRSELAAYRTDQQEIVRFRKNVILLVKFFLLSLTFLFSSSLLSLFYMLMFLRPDSVMFLVAGYVGFVSYALESVVLVGVHSILKQTFVSIIYRPFLCCFCCFKQFD